MMTDFRNCVDSRICIKCYKLVTNIVDEEMGLSPFDFYLACGLYNLLHRHINAGLSESIEYEMSRNS